ncbi:MAG TPA: hypothetical protein VLA34_07870, partial [Candidatus Krumholzibacterium sp.]|nr:hypothetical protein [Candidatus Krumholzibacterium sp.]
IMLSGFIFAIKVMPLPLRVISHVIPARYFITVTRAILLKGAGFGALTTQAIALVILMVVLITAATKNFKAGV